ncbi:MAG: T9SS type A sorting domain-containing protein, partial [Polaribacter sp.]
NTSLTDLSCGNNILSNLDVSANTSLTDLSCTNNNLSSLNVSSNTLLTSLYCSDNNLTSLDVSSNILLTSLYCFDNNLTNFDLTSNTSLTDLRCSNNSIKDLNVSSSNNLAYFDCSDNELVSLNIKIGNKFKLRGSNFLATNNPNLTCINVDDAAFSTLNLKNIDRVVNFSEDCSGTHTNDTYIEDTNFEQSLIDLGYDTELDNYVTTAIITSISTLNISGKSIKSIKGIEYFTGLTSLDCSNNELSQINLENNVELEILNCSSNNLTSLVLDSNIELRWLDCNSNNLFELNIKNGNNSNFSFFSSFLNSDLVCIEVDNTSFSNENWFNISSQITFSENCGSYKKPGYTYIPDDNFEQALIQFGYDNSTDNYVLTENISGLTELNLYFFNISNLKGIEDFVSLTSLNCSVNNFTSLDLSSNTALTTLNCTNNKELTSLNISSNTLLTTLNCYNNSLIDLNVSSNTLLTSLSCSSNNLSNLDISANLLLNQLNCSTNYLNSLNINSNTLLTSLSCSSNNLTSLDIGANLLLNQLNSSVNYLSSIDISKNIDLIELNCSDNNLSSLYLKNGNNTFFIKFNAVNNPNLNCIEVDNAAYSTTNWTDIDSHTSFSEDCSATASVEKLEKESYSLYPNPFSDKIHIKSTTSIDAIVITTLQGKEILRTKEITEELDVSNLSSGMYLLKLIFGANIAVEKIIKE